MINILAQIGVDETNKLTLQSSLPKKELINLLLDIVKMIVNQDQEQNKIVVPK